MLVLDPQQYPVHVEFIVYKPIRVSASQLLIAITQA